MSGTRIIQTLGITGAAALLGLSGWVAIRTWPRPMHLATESLPPVRFEHGKMIVALPTKALLSEVGRFDDELSAYLWFDYLRSRPGVEGSQVLLTVLDTEKSYEHSTKPDIIGAGSPHSQKEQSQLVEDYLRPAAIRACVIREKDDITYGPDGEAVKRFGFHTFRHSLATCLMHEQENPAVVQAIMRHSKMDMTLYYSHSRRSAKRAAQERVLQRLVVPAAPEMRVPMRVRETIQ